MPLMSECIKKENVKHYIKLDDNVCWLIQHYLDDQMEPLPKRTEQIEEIAVNMRLAREILNKILKRQHYRCISKKIVKDPPRVVSILNFVLFWGEGGIGVLYQCNNKLAMFDTSSCRRFLFQQIRWSKVNQHMLFKPYVPELCHSTTSLITFLFYLTLQMVSFQLSNRSFF